MRWIPVLMKPDRSGPLLLHGADDIADAVLYPVGGITAHLCWAMNPCLTGDAIII